MARRKKHSRKRHSRRRGSMGAIGGGMTNLLSIVAGAVIGKVVAKKLESSVNPKILAGGQIAAGVILPRFVKNKFVAGIGTGMIVNGAMSGLQQFGVISAINGMVGADEIVYEYDTMSGTDELQAIAGYTDEGTMTGTDMLQSIAAMDLEEMTDDEQY